MADTMADGTKVDNTPETERKGGEPQKPQAVDMWAMLLSRMDGTIRTFAQEVNISEQYSNRDEVLKWFTGPLTAIVNNTASLGDERKLALSVELSRLGILDEAVDFVAKASNLAVAAGAIPPDRTAGDILARTLETDISGELGKMLESVGDERIGTIKGLLARWAASRTKPTNGTSSPNRTSGSGPRQGTETPMTVHCLHPGCRWSTFGQSGVGNIMDRAKSHHHSHHSDKEKISAGSPIFDELNNAVKAVFGGANESIDAPLAEMRVDPGNTQNGA